MVPVVVCAHTDVGTYTLACTWGSAGTNYTFDETDTATLTVGPATLTVTVTGTLNPNALLGMRSNGTGVLL